MIMFTSMLNIALGLLVTTVSASPIKAPEPVPPSQDPWYTAPVSFDAAAPGQVLGARSAPGNLTTIFDHRSAAYNILFRTTDSNYQPSWAVTTLLVPRHTNTSALLSYQIPYNSADVDSSPSYTLYTYGGLVLTDIQNLLKLGYYVNVPDFEGPLASFGLGVQEGHATLDSIRAVLHNGFGLTQDARMALWGYSGGSLASEWAAELQVQYAPELTFVGAALGGLVDNGSVVLQDTATWWSGLTPVALLVITSQNPAARQYLISQLKTSVPYNKTGFLAALDVGIETAFDLYANQTILSDYFVNGNKALQAPIIQDIVDANLYMGYHGVPQMPLFIYKAVQDEIAPIESTEALVKRYCNVGANIVFERNVIGGHLAEETNGDSRVLEFLQIVLGGGYEHEGCTVRDVALNVTDSPM